MIIASDDNKTECECYWRSGPDKEHQAFRYVSNGFYYEGSRAGEQWATGQKKSVGYPFSGILKIGEERKVKRKG